jgi:hypothetical protein
VNGPKYFVSSTQVMREEVGFGGRRVSGALEGGTLERRPPSTGSAATSWPTGEGRGTS